MESLKSLVEANKTYLKAKWNTQEFIEIHQPYSTELEEALLRKYQSMKNEKLIKHIGAVASMRLSKRLENSSGLLFDACVDEDIEKEKMLMAICPGIKTLAESKFYLEASSYNITEAEKLFQEQTIEKPQMIKRTVEVIFTFNTGAQVNYEFQVTDSLWEIGTVVYNATESNNEFQAIIKNTNKVITLEELTSKTFKDLGIKDQENIIIEFL